MPKDIYAYLSEIIFDGGQFDFAGHKTLALRGAEAQSFLHNQSSNNIVKMENNSFQINALLDISAKLIGFFYVLKVNPQELYVVSHSEFFEEIVERLEKYLIAEDVGLNVLDQALYGYMGTRCLKNLNDQKAFKGMFAGEEAFLSFTDHKRSIIDSEKLNFLKIVTGHPEWRETIHEKELFNNTSLIDLAYDKDKGCFLGQETVAKVESRRGAAFKPLLLINSLPMKAPQALDQLRLNGKKIGKALASSVLGGQTYILASLNREARIEGKMLEFDEPTVFKATAKYLPLYAFFDKAGGFYHFAVDNFQKGDEQISEEFLLKAIEADPSFEDAYESLGVLYGRQEKYEKAIELMDQLAKLNKKSVMAHTNLSLYYMKVGEIEKAEEEKSLATIMQFESLGEEA
ncbi:MAG: tetratricopeptide repeat protein, partial [Bacteriovoracaceae bacterium]